MSDDDPIFVAEDGSPLKIFVEPTDVPDRAARLIKKLKKCGANIRISFHDANIVIVGEDVDIRRKVVNTVKDKIILDYKWIQASAKREACYLSEDNWGGYRVFPEEQDNAPLPTPRPSPADDAVQSSIAAHSQPLPAHIPAVQAQFPFPLPNAQFNPQMAAMMQQLMNSFPPPAQPAPYGQPWALDTTALLSGPTMLLPVPLQQRILDHMLSLSPNNQISWQLAQLVEQFTRQQASGHAVMSGLSMHPHVPAQPYMPPPASQYNHVSAPPPVFQQGSSSELTTFDRGRSASVSRPSESVSATVQVKRERVSRDDGSSRHKKPRRSTTEDDDDKQARATREQPAGGTPPRARPVFIDRKGKPIPIYVQHAKWRNKYIPSIQKHGGKIVAGIADADYAVLFAQSLGSWDYLRIAIDVGTPAVKPVYITECIEKGKLLNSSSYSFEGSQLKDEHGNLYVAKLAELRAQAREGKQKKVPRKARSPSGEEEEESGDEKTAKPKKAAGKRFTDEELAEAKAYIPELLEKDLTISATAIYQSLSTKIPTHSAASWGYKVGGHESMVEHARRKARAKAKTRQEAEQEAEQEAAKEVDKAQTESVPIPQPAQPDPEPQPTTPEQPLETDLFHEDVAAIVNEFVKVVNGQYDDKTDEEVFTILSSTVTCKTAAAWQDFYTQHQELIENLVTEFSNQTQQSA